MTTLTTHMDTLGSIKDFIREQRNVIASLSEVDDDDNQGELSLLWWEKGVCKSLSIWPDGLIHFSAHYDGKTLSQWMPTDIDDLTANYTANI